MSDRKLKLLFIIDKLTYGGAEKITYDLACELSKLSKYSVKILSLNKPIIEINNEDKKKLIFPKNYIKKFFYFKRYPGIYKLIDNFKPDIIHSSKEIADWLTAIYKILHPSVVAVSAIHTYQQNRQHKIEIKHKIQFWLQGILYNRFNKVVCVSNDLKRYMQEKYSVKKENLAVVYNGVKNPHFFPKFDINKKFKGDLVFIGGIRPVKNLEIIISTMTVLPSYYTLTIIGDGPSKAKIENIVAEMNLSSRIRFLGFIHNAYNKLSEYDILIIPSFHETFSLTALEALLTGIPVIATNSGGITELFKDRLDDLLFNVNNFEELKNKILYVEKNYREIVNKISKNRNFYMKFSLENMALQYKSIYESYKI
jgi:glycosyltransferase involved in cell wall biosynthesis